MNLHPLDHRAIRLIKHVLRLGAEFIILPLLMVVALCQAVGAQEPCAPLANRAPPSTEQVAHNLVQMNLRRTQALQAYQGRRVYRIEYHGFPGTRTAEMVVNVKYWSPGTKEFSIQSATGAKLLHDKVFNKLMEAEQEALGAEMQRRSALSDENYRFTLAGYEGGPSGPLYVLEVEPRTKDKFLYRGRIWIDAQDFAIVRLKAEPAKNPSFWTKNSEIDLVEIHSTHQERVLRVAPGQVAAKRAMVRSGLPS